VTPYKLTLLDDQGDPHIGFDLTEIAFENATSGDMILQHEGITYIFDDANGGEQGGEVTYKPVQTFAPISEDGGEVWIFAEVPPIIG
jgi:hypothetical protein